MICGGVFPPDSNRGIMTTVSGISKRIEGRGRNGVISCLFFFFTGKAPVFSVVDRRPKKKKS